MKTKRVIYLVIAIVLTLADILSTASQLKVLRSHFSTEPYDIGYLFGSQILLYVALIFWWATNRISKKLRVQDVYS